MTQDIDKANRPALEVTPAMIEAGEWAIFHCDGVSSGVGFFDPRDLAEKVYRAMEICRVGVLRGFQDSNSEIPGDVVERVAKAMRKKVGEPDLIPEILDLDEVLIDGHVNFLELAAVAVREAASEVSDTVTISKKEYFILQSKARSTLGNNLCPDHRDKQHGKPCLACTIEGLESKLKRESGSEDA